MTKISGGRFKSMNKSINKFRQQQKTVSAQYFVLIPSSTRLRPIDFRRYILGFCVTIYFHENSRAYAVGGIVVRIYAAHWIKNIPAWDG